jgi:hypothetical protein
MHRGTRRARYVALVGVVCAAATAMLMSAGPATAASPASQVRLSTIAPGKHAAIQVATPVNIVFVGYQPSAINVRRLLGGLPAHGDPDVRSVSYWGGTQDVGLRYDYSYHVRFAGKAFDDAFFGFLAKPLYYFDGPDPVQQAYNAQEHNTVDVTGDVLLENGPATEAWLETQAQARLGIPRAQDTIYFINWYGRSDFHFHEYEDFGHPDPDSGVDLNQTYEGLTRAWGGTSGPTWFLDLSAGPVYSDESWDVDDADYDGDGITDYRLPPIWDYGSTDAYRPFTDLSGDLGLVTRYVALDMLFTASPLFDPAATIPQPGGVKQVAMDIFEGDPAANGLNDVQPALIQAQHASLEPYYGIKVGVTDQPLGADLRSALTAAENPTTSPPPPCLAPDSPDSQYGQAYLYCYARAHNADLFPAPGPNAVVPVLGFTVPEDAGNMVDFRGDTDDDYSTGAPSYIYAVDTPHDRAFADTGYTQTVTHEVGHYVGLSHPHDGYDPTSGVDFLPGDEFAFAWLGDESDSVMSYRPGSESFDVFDRDNLARWQVGRLLDLADGDAAAILKHGLVAQAIVHLAKADIHYAAALAAIRQANWIGAATDAVAGYTEIQLADAAAGITPGAVQVAALQSNLASTAAKVTGIDPLTDPPRIVSAKLRGVTRAATAAISLHR